jgi:hypothetical protein
MSVWSQCRPGLLIQTIPPESLQVQTSGGLGDESEAPVIFLYLTTEYSIIYLPGVRWHGGYARRIAKEIIC